MTDEPIFEAREVSKSYGTVRALTSVSLRVEAGRVTCLLGDNGAGKSSLIKILSGVASPDAGTLAVDGSPVRFADPKDALTRGIATVYQDLAVVPDLPVYRNFFMGREPVLGRGPLARFDKRRARRVTQEQLESIGISLADPERPISTLSGGERQSVAVARAVYFGAKVLLLDEPTSALGVRQAETVLRYAVRAKQQGVGVVLITHNAHHAWAVGDRFVVLQRGEVSVDADAGEISLDELIRHMAGGADIAELQRELRADRVPAPGAGI
ncbi:ATP-binding cassette domain-containing protein [Thermomonospora umbrina]|uniref:Monosaccharide ABC transporter ATP-binding protein (CUT2 family) n=1 Tax=Thermomonospora umbrina TaxID=111806 RepID=A0A3D9TAI7_9ACTN|nr:ATP-binding cassette domain-containing protein [Thermomonospora umbrina]REF00782.1 monosaccharide ABC transporter ATP-binding protein (CUT2 family) [Thermomonospora umbrina]